MLDPGQDAPARDALAQQARAQIDAAGTVKHENSWGLRKMAYEIDQRTEADYRWFRFEAPTDLLGQLDHNLKIADGVLRFRIFKVDPGAPVIVPPATGATGSSRERPAPGAPAAAPAAAAEEVEVEAPQVEAAAEPVAEAPAEAVPESAAEAVPEAGAESPPEAAPESGADEPAEPAA